MPVLSYDHYDMPIIESETEPGEYAIAFTDEIADYAAKQYIEDSLWAFNASFLAEMTDLPEEMFSGLQDKCEGANDAFLKVVQSTCGLDTFVDVAIAADGRGHFMSSYDDDEYTYSDMTAEFQAEIRQLLEEGELDWPEYDSYMSETDPEYSADTNWEYFENDHILGKVYIYRIN